MCQTCVQNYPIRTNNTSRHTYIEPSVNMSSSQIQGAGCVTRTCSDVCDCCSISPHCEYCACSEPGEDSGYVDIEFTPETSSRLHGSNLSGETEAGVSDRCQNSHNILRYPIIIKNNGRTRKLTSRDGHVLSGGVLYNSRCDRYSETENNSRQLWNNPHCYEVTVNVEWI